MRIALVSPLFESVPPRLYGGTERVIHQLCNGLSAAGVDVTLFASGDSDTSARLVPIIPGALRLARPGISDPTPYNFKLLADVRRCAHLFDVIHNHHDYWMLPLTEMTETPVLTTLHGRMDLPGIDAAFESFPRTSYISISDDQRRPMPGLNWARTIHHGIDATQFEFNPSPGKYLAFLGRMSKDKRPDWAIDIAEKSGVPLKLAAKIEGTADRQYFDACVKPRIDGRFIEYVGEITEAEKSRFLGDALAMVFPIDWPEPFGLVMLKSLACGTPVLARPCGAVSEVLQDGVTGYVHLNTAVLASKVKDLGRVDRGDCRRWVERRFSLARMTEDYINVYRQLIELGKSEIRPNRGGRNFLYPVERIAHGYRQG